MNNPLNSRRLLSLLFVLCFGGLSAQDFAYMELAQCAKKPCLIGLQTKTGSTNLKGHKALYTLNGEGLKDLDFQDLNQLEAYLKQWVFTQEELDLHYLIPEGEDELILIGTYGGKKGFLRLFRSASEKN